MAVGYRVVHGGAGGTPEPYVAGTLLAVFVAFREERPDGRSLAFEAFEGHLLAAPADLTVSPGADAYPLGEPL